MIISMRSEKLLATVMLITSLLSPPLPALVRGQLFTEADNEQCPIFACCEQDCCGKGTLWVDSIQYCVENPDSNGFDGNYSPSWQDGCTSRVCCEQHCCLKGLEYDAASALCVIGTCKDEIFQGIKQTTGILTMDEEMVEEMYNCCLRYAGVLLRRVSSYGYEDQRERIELCPGNGVTKDGKTYDFVLADERTVTSTCDSAGLCELSGDGLLLLDGGSCDSPADCLSGRCFTGGYDYEDEDGYCVCNCADNEVCVHCESYSEHVGEPTTEECERLRVSPFSCYLKLGEACGSGYLPGACETGQCVDGVCVCSPKTYYPCDVETEACLNSVCQPRPPACTAQGKPYEFIQSYSAIPTISLINITSMYECCQSNGDVSLLRKWQGNATTTGNPPREYIPTRTDDNPIVLCPGRGLTKDKSTYRFTLADGSVVVATCSTDTGLCKLTGDGLASDYRCFRNDNCKTGSCYIGRYETQGFGYCDCNPNTQIGCEDDNENEICANSSMIFATTGYESEYTGNRCKKITGEPCSFDSACFSRNCDQVDLSVYKFGVCACTPHSNYPCDIDNGEKCIISNGAWTCK